MLELAKHLGSAGTGALIVLVFTALAVATLLLVQRWLPWLQVDREYSDFGQIFGGAVGTMFALVFALVTIAIWQNYDRVASDVASEANCLHNIDRYLDAYPPALSGPAENLMQAYLRRLIQSEWPMMAAASTGEDPEAGRLISDVNARLVAYRPATLGELPLHQEMLSQITMLRTLRHSRLDAGKAYLDASMWISLVIGSITLLVFCSVWRIPDRKQHLVLMLTLGSSLGVVFFLLVTYNHPFAGPEAIGPAPFQALLR